MISYDYMSKFERDRYIQHFVMPIGKFITAITLKVKCLINPLKLILIIFTQTLFIKSHDIVAFATCICLMPHILYTKYHMQKWISPFCSTEKGLSSATKIFKPDMCFGRTHLVS